MVAARTPVEVVRRREGSVGAADERAPRPGPEVMGLRIPERRRGRSPAEELGLAEAGLDQLTFHVVRPDRDQGHREPHPDTRSIRKCRVAVRRVMHRNRDCNASGRVVAGAEESRSRALSV